MIIIVIILSTSLFQVFCSMNYWLIFVQHKVHSLNPLISLYSVLLRLLSYKHIFTDLSPVYYTTCQFSIKRFTN